MKPFKRPNSVKRCRPLYSRKKYSLLKDDIKDERIYIVRVAYNKRAGDRT